MSLSLPANEAAEFNRLCAALPGAVERASRVYHLSWDEYASDIAADAHVSQILARITFLANEPI